MAQKFRITYATLSADNEDLQRNYDEAAERMKAELGKEYPVIVNGEERWREDRYHEPSPSTQRSRSGASRRRPSKTSRTRSPPRRRSPWNGIGSAGRSGFGSSATWTT